MRCAHIVGKGFEKTLRDFQIQTASPTFTFVIIGDFEKEEQVERRSTKKEKQAKQLVEVKQLANFSLVLVEGGFFDIEVGSLDIPVVVTTKSRSKYMMRCKGKE